MSQIDFERILKRFCFLSFFDNIYYFDHDYIITKLDIVKSRLSDVEFEIPSLIKDLKISVSLWVEDSGIYSFAHRSLQEFYASLYIKSLNYENKNLLYKKLMSKLIDSKLSDIENLLSLCKEMDQINYLNYIELPLLQKLEKGLNTSNEKK